MHPWRFGGTGAAEALREATVRNLYYQGVLTAATAGAGALAVLVLARVLSPAEYGAASFAYLITSAAEMIADFGILSAVLTRREEIGASAAAAATLRLALAGCAAAALALLALLAGGPFHEPSVAPLLLVLSIVPLVSGLGFASQVKLRLALDFKRLSIAQAGGMIGSPAAQATLALAGFGVWSIVYGAVIGHLLQFVFLTAVAPAFFRPRVDRRAWRALLNFGAPVTGMGLVSSAFDITAAALVVWAAGPIALGAFLLGVRVAQIVPLRAMSIVNEVLLPTLSKIRAAGGALTGPYLEAIAAVLIPSALANFAALALAAPAVALIGGARWESAAVYVQVMALYFVLQSMTAPATPFVQVQGHPGAGLRQAAACYALLVGVGAPAIYYGGLPAFLLALLAIMAFAWAYMSGIVSRLGGPTRRAAARAALPGVAACTLGALGALALANFGGLPDLPAVVLGGFLFLVLTLAADTLLFNGVNLARVQSFARGALHPHK